MKKYLIFIFTAIIVIFLITNKTFFKDTYSNKIVIPKFSYFISESKLLLEDKECCDTSIELISLKSEKKLEEFKNNFLENLQSCYDESYFYDSNNNISYNIYEIKKEFLFKKIKINFSEKNVCKEEFVLNDNWLNIFEESIVTESNFNYELLIEKLKKSKRLELKSNLEFDDKYQVSYLNNKNGYTLYFKKYDEKTLGIILLDENDAKKYAIYDIGEDVDLFLFNGN